MEGFINKKDSLLILIDLQNDFMPGGALAVPFGDEIIPGIRELVFKQRFKYIIGTQDWHPNDHVSFASAHKGKKPFDVIDLYGEKQVLWPDHCVMGTKGAEFHRDVPQEAMVLILRKGWEKEVDSYSAFKTGIAPEGKRRNTGLEGYLKLLGIKNIYVCGLARDYCVKWTAEDAKELGFNTFVIWDLTRPVDKNSDKSIRDELENKGIAIISSGEI